MHRPENTLGVVVLIMFSQENVYDVEFAYIILKLTWHYLFLFGNDCIVNSYLIKSNTVA